MGFTDLMADMQFLSTPSARRATGGTTSTEWTPTNFYPRPPRGGRHPTADSAAVYSDFYPRPPRGGRHPSAGRWRRVHNFYPRPPRGGRRCQPRPGSRPDQFLSTPSARRATAIGERQDVKRLISIHALREEGDAGAVSVLLYPVISIHALREEGDALKKRQIVQGVDFYPRPPRGGRPPLPWLHIASGKNFYPRPPRGGRHGGPDPSGRGFRFLSTPSARRATAIRLYGKRKSLYFYPRPPRGGRLYGVRVIGLVHEFLSTPSARRATAVAGAFVILWNNFYPRPPRGGRRFALCQDLLPGLISIHALREEGDVGQDPPFLRPFDFYPRPPRGGRRLHFLPCHHCQGFLSTPSARRATRSAAPLFVPDKISIHALREEGDVHWTDCTRTSGIFLSTPSARRATSLPIQRPPSCTISIHALREEGDLFSPCPRGRGSRFLSTPSARRATWAPRRRSTGLLFLSTPSARRATRVFNNAPIILVFLSTPSARRATAHPAPRSPSARYFYPRPPRGGRPSPCPVRLRHPDFYPRPPRGGRPRASGMPPR